MSRYRGPRVRILKRLGYLPGFGKNKKFIFFKQKKQASSSFQKKKKKNREKEKFTIRLKEKQKLRFNYGLTEKNLTQYVKKAQKKKKKKTSAGQILLNSLEMRLDNIVFRLGFAPTLSAARQFVTHGHILLNGKKRDVPSSQCKVNDLITISKKIQSQFEIKNQTPNFLSFDSTTLRGKIQNYPSRNQIELDIKELLVIEYYSRKF